MPSVVAALALLLLNLGIIGAVLAFSPTPRGGRHVRPSADGCLVCSTPDPDRSVGRYPVCDACATEYFRAVD